MSITASYYAYTLEERKKLLENPETYILKYTAECYIDKSYYLLHNMLTNGAKEPVKGSFFSLGIVGWYEPDYELDHPNIDLCRWDTWSGEGFLTQAEVKEVAEAFANVDIKSKVHDTKMFSTESLIWHFNNLKDFYQQSARKNCCVEVALM